VKRRWQKCRMQPSRICWGNILEEEWYGRGSNWPRVIP
jgi:hypothetical protein